MYLDRFFLVITGFCWVWNEGPENQPTKCMSFFGWKCMFEIKNRTKIFCSNPVTGNTMHISKCVLYENTFVNTWSSQETRIRRKCFYFVLCESLIVNCISFWIFSNILLWVFLFFFCDYLFVFVLIFYPEKWNIEYIFFEPNTHEIHIILEMNGNMFFKMKILYTFCGCQRTML